MDKDFGLVAVSGEKAEMLPMPDVVRAKINAILKEQLDEAVSLIESGKEKVDKLVRALIEKNKLNREEIDELLSDKAG